MLGDPGEQAPVYGNECEPDYSSSQQMTLMEPFAEKYSAERDGTDRDQHRDEHGVEGT